MMFDVNDVRALFISDVHLGSRHAQTNKFLDFLGLFKKHPPKSIYIVGDFLDGWELKRNWYWTDQNTLVICNLLSFVKKGSQIFYVAGNHDEFLRSFMTELSFGSSITFEDEFIHETADGRQILVVHGDKFDMSVKYAKWLCHLGDIGYDILIHTNRFVNWCRRCVGFYKYWSLSKAVKGHVNQAVSFIWKHAAGDFENFLSKYAKDRQCDGVICGHIHTPAIKKINNIRYYNTGDWVETCSAIIETASGEIKLVYHNDTQPDKPA